MYGCSTLELFGKLLDLERYFLFFAVPTHKVRGHRKKKFLKLLNFHREVGLEILHDLEAVISVLIGYNPCVANLIVSEIMGMTMYPEFYVRMIADKLVKV